MNTLPLRRIVLAALIAAAAASLAGCGANAHAPADSVVENPGTPVEVGQVTRANLAATYEVTGALEAEREATILTELPGEVVEVLVEEGDRVAEGQVLARLDGARARLELRQAEVLAERMRYDSARNERLIERSMISRDAYDRGRFDLDTQRAAVGLARLTASKSEIRAPYAGVITRRHIKEGQWLTLQSKSFEIADFSELQARVAVPERAAALMHAGRPAAFQADALPGTHFVGAIERVSPVVDRATGTVAVVVSVENPDATLRPGLFVRLAVNYADVPDATLVPKLAVLSEGGRSRVFVVENGVAQQREVALGLEQRGQVQVLAGVEPGATVVTVGHSSLRDGDKVRVIESESSEQVAAAPASAPAAS
jgi:membrane fusion protein (multidrug efflux system)